MAVKRSQNWVNQQRVDVPHLRSVESAIRNDFDELINSFAIGEDASYVIRGFEISMASAIGSSATSLQMIVADSSLFHGASNESGTFFQIPSGTANQTLSSTTNTRVSGSFTSSAINYVGLEYTRAVDNSTIAQVFLWNPTNKIEISKTIPLAEVFDYQIVITASIWTSNVIPISIVNTDSSNNVTSVEDRRPMLFRLGTGGSSTPDPFYVYPWTNDAEGRVENYWSSSSSASPFRGGDKQLLQFKEWADAVMSQILEIKGTTYWYSPNSGGSLIKLRGDLAHLQMTGSGKFIHASATAGRINWDSDFYLNFIGSRLKYKINSNAATSDITLTDDQVAYINIVRGVDISSNLIFTNGSPTVSSVGAVSWTTDVLAGDYVKIGSEDDTKYYPILTVDSVSQVTLSENFAETSTGSSGTQAKYAYGFYETNAAPSTNRHVQVADRKDVPFAEDTYWLFVRADNGASSAKVYIRGSAGGELEQGEDRQIADNQTLDILDYAGSAGETDTTPDYTNAIVTGVLESRTITFPAASALTTGEYFTMPGALDANQFYVWANIDAGGGNPAPGGYTSAETAILSTDTNVQVAAKFHAIIDAIPDFDSTDNVDGTLTVANAKVGICTDAANVDMGAGFSVVTDTPGVGSFNSVVIDDENLTKGIKRLDDAVGVIQVSLHADPIDLLNSAVTQITSNARYSWDGSDLTITDDNGGPADADVLGRIRMWTRATDFDLTRQDGTGGSTTLSIADGEVLFVELPTTGSRIFSAAGSGSTNYQTVTRGSFVASIQNYWLAFREGGKVYIRGIGELESGEIAQLSDNINENILTAAGLSSETATPSYTATSSGSLNLPDYNATPNEAWIPRIAKVNAMLADIQQNYNVEIDLGVVVWDGSNITVTGAQLSIPGTTIGAGPIAINTYGSSALADNSCLYVDINRTTAGALTFASSTIAALTPSQQRLVVVRRIGSDLWMR